MKNKALKLINNCWICTQTQSTDMSFRAKIFICIVVCYIAKAKPTSMLMSYKAIKSVMCITCTVVLVFLKRTRESHAHLAIVAVTFGGNQLETNKPRNRLYKGWFWFVLLRSNWKLKRGKETGKVSCLYYLYTSHVLCSSFDLI